MCHIFRDALFWILLRNPLKIHLIWNIYFLCQSSPYFFLFNSHLSLKLSLKSDLYSCNLYSFEFHMKTKLKLYNMQFLSIMGKFKLLTKHTFDVFVSIRMDSTSFKYIILYERIDSYCFHANWLLHWVWHLWTNPFNSYSYNCL